MALFDTFAAVISEMPARAILHSLELERRMIEDDILSGRTFAEDDSDSILQFCRFVKGMKLAVAQPRAAVPLPVPAVALPREHVDFYRKTVIRLIKAKVLPDDTLKRFELAFAGASRKAVEDFLDFAVH